MYLLNLLSRICKFPAVRVTSSTQGLRIVKIMWPSRWIVVAAFLVHLINVNAVCTVSQANIGYYYSIYSEARCTHISSQDIISFRKSNPTIEVINITASDASFLGPGIFHDLNYLKWIYIKYSNIPKIIKGMFPTPGQLNVIDLSFSNISMIEKGSFNGLYRLKTLNVSQNNLVDVNFFEEGMAHYPPVFDLSHNQIADISGLSVCKNLVHVNLSFNAITKLQRNQFAELTNLMRLDLKRNSINILEDDCFSGLNSLQFLELSDNQIARISEGSFKDASSLTFLNLSRNKIESIAPGTFAGLISLETIDLSFNKISFLQTDVLLDLYGIQRLIINHNSMSDINAEDLVTYLTHLHSVSLDGNNWTCSKLSNVIRSFRPKPVIVELGSNFKVKNLNGIACSGDGGNSVDQNLRDSNLFKQVDKDFLNSKFYKYFTDGYINATFFEYLDKKIEEMKTLHGDVQFNKTEYEEGINNTFSEYFSSLKSKNDYLRDLGGEEETNNAILRTLTKLMITLLFVLLVIWITLSMIMCKLLKINVSLGFVNFLSLCRSRKQFQNQDDQLL